MTRQNKVQYFESEGRDHLPEVIKSIKAYLRSTDSNRMPRKLVFLTRQGEGPMLAYNHIPSDGMKIIAVTFPRYYAGRRDDGSIFAPEIPERIRKFFDGVGIEVITSRLPFDDISGAEAHNREMGVLRDALALFGSSIPLAVQAVLQATDAGKVDPGEMVIAATGDTALLVTASTTQLFLMKDERGLAVNEIICKPRVFDRSRKALAPKLPAGEPHGAQIEGSVGEAPKA
jgi:hypothetical protein